MSFRIISLLIVLNSTMLLGQESRVERWSQDYLYAVRTGSNQEADSLARVLAGISSDDFESQVGSDSQKLAFWLNMYNATVQDRLSKQTELYTNRSAFYKAKLVNIAGSELSLDDIEHGILRRSKVKWSWGYLNRLFEKQAVRSWRVLKPDYRIHFALNCGASSCPPIAFYESKDIDSQLEAAERFFVQQATSVNEKEGYIETTPLFSWFRADFGGIGGVRSILRKHGFEKVQELRLKFAKYDWSLELKKYSEQ